MIVKLTSILLAIVLVGCSSTGPTGSSVFASSYYATELSLKIISYHKLAGKWPEIRDEFEVDGENFEDLFEVLEYSYVDDEFHVKAQFSGDTTLWKMVFISSNEGHKQNLNMKGTKVDSYKPPAKNFGEIMIKAATCAFFGKDYLSCNA